MKLDSQTDDTLLTENVSRDILSIIRYLLTLTVSESRVKNGKKIRTYLQILKVALKEHGELVLRHLIRYGACTPFELYEVYGINYTTVGRILNLLQDGEIVKQVGYVGRPYYNIGDGRQVKIYLLKDAEPLAGVEAQKRYGEIQRSKRGDTLRQTELEEAFNVVKLFLDKRDVKRIPEKQFIVQLLRENDFKGIEYDRLVRQLVRNGYKL